MSVRHPVGAVRGGCHAETAARRVEVGVDEQRVADHLHVVTERMSGATGTNAVGEAQQVDDVRVDEVPLVEHGEAPALADLDGAPVLLDLVVAEDPAGRRRPRPGSAPRWPRGSQPGEHESSPSATPGSLPRISAIASISSGSQCSSNSAWIEALWPPDAAMSLSRPAFVSCA